MKVLYIAGRELRAAFTTTVGWIVLCGWLEITGLFWVLLVSNYAMESQNLVFNPYAGAYMNLTDYLLSPFFGNCAVILVMVVPALTMRTFSEEFANRSMELLATSPVSTAEIVLGKYLGVLGFVLILLGLTLQYPVSLLRWGSPDWGAIAGGYIGLLLLSSVLLAMGIWFSSLTKNQLVSLILTFVVALGLMVLEWGSRSPDDWMAQLSYMSHLSEVLQGAIRLSDLAYFGGGVVFFLLATHQRMESFRWS
ncbi:MAG TPA: hypothetical protein ENK18_11795 [Deltaproteobacteria bacterium]|nr:hypothetical protein [Deltaproteobacteria bacterium]